LKGCREGELRQNWQIKALAPGHDKSGDQADQDHRAADKRIKHQFHRAVFTLGGSPAGDEKVLWNDGQLVKDEEQKEVEAQENAIDGADQPEIKRKELLRP